ncbi:MAG: hypothetical protein CMK59_07180, partial [Proteobacteria bacterium]|nr:hypothetical protein [Pseudomonadota bacterium]
MFILLSALALGVPLQMVQQGRVVDSSGVPYEGAHVFEFRIYDEQTGGNLLWTEIHAANVLNGYYSVVLGADVLLNPLDESVLALYPLYLELEIDTGTPLARQPIQSAPYAQMSGVAESVDGGSVNASDISIGGAPVVDSGRNWVGEPLTVDWSGVTGIPNGFSDGVDDVLNESQVEGFITNGGLDLSSNTTLGGQSIVTADNDQDSLALFSCTDGQILKYDSAIGDWFCEADSDSLNSLSCAHDQLIRYDQALGSWVCAEDVFQGLNCGADQVMYNNGSSWVCQDSTALFDKDVDGIPTWEDCDDTDSGSYSKAEDMDCDGFLLGEDCDNADPTSYTIYEDGDCDGTPTADDCNDNDANSTTVATDGDCDGYVFASDCDDTDPNSTVVGQDFDCDGFLEDVDCDNTDPTSYTTNEDGDCDGTPTADDCDDNDENSTTLATDGDCDGDLSSSDCDDADNSIFHGAQEVCDDGVDQDCDGDDAPCFVEVTFTSCGQDGRNGPSQSQCNSSYSGTALEGLVTVSAGIQVWTVPSTATYTIEAIGAAGSDPSLVAAGYGASMRGDFTLTAGTELQILVGQFPDVAVSNGAGGGGTFVTQSPHNLEGDILVIAGGGGGVSS